MCEAFPRFFSTEFKVDVVARLERGEPAARIAREAGVARKRPTLAGVRAKPSQVGRPLRAPRPKG